MKDCFSHGMGWVRARFFLSHSSFFSLFVRLTDIKRFTSFFFLLSNPELDFSFSLLLFFSQPDAKVEAVEFAEWGLSLSFFLSSLAHAPSVFSTFSSHNKQMMNGSQKSSRRVLLGWGWRKRWNKSHSSNVQKNASFLSKERERGEKKEETRERVRIVLNSTTDTASSCVSSLGRCQQQCVSQNSLRFFFHALPPSSTTTSGAAVWGFCTGRLLFLLRSLSLSLALLLLVGLRIRCLRRTDLLLLRKSSFHQDHLTNVLRSWSELKKKRRTTAEKKEGGKRRKKRREERARAPFFVVFPFFSVVHDSFFFLGQKRGISRLKRKEEEEKKEVGKKNKRRKKRTSFTSFFSAFQPPFLFFLLPFSGLCWGFPFRILYAIPSLACWKATKQTIKSYCSICIRLTTLNVQIPLGWTIGIFISNFPILVLSSTLLMSFHA